MGSIVGHRIDYNGVGVLRGQRHIPSKTWPKYPPPIRDQTSGFRCLSNWTKFICSGLVVSQTIQKQLKRYSANFTFIYYFLTCKSDLQIWPANLTCKSDLQTQPVDLTCSTCNLQIVPSVFCVAFRFLNEKLFCTIRFSSLGDKLAPSFFEDNTLPFFRSLHSHLTNLRILSNTMSICSFPTV